MTMETSDSFIISPPLTPIENALEREGESSCMNFLNLSNENEPIVNSSNLNNDLPCLFDCKGENHPNESIGKNSYLGSSALSNLLYYGKPFLSTNYSTNMSVKPELFVSKLSHCFMKIRKTIQKLEKNVKPFCSGKVIHGIKNGSPFNLRKEVVYTLHGLSLFVSELTVDNKDEFIQSLIEETVELLRFLGPLYLLPSHVLNASSTVGNKCSSAAYHLLHLHLDVRWWFLALFHQVEFLLGKEIEFPTSCLLDIFTSFVKELNLNALPEDDSKQSVFDSFIHIFIWDILTVMEKQTSKGSISEVFFYPPSSCICSFELAVSVFHLTEWRHKFNRKKVFWSLINEKLSLLLKLTSDHINEDVWTQCSVNDFNFPPATFKDIKPFQIWWIFTNIAKVFQYDPEGNKLYQPKADIEMLKKLITQTIINSGRNCNSEEELRLYLRCCHFLLHLWKQEKELKQSTWVIVLWDFYSKVMDSNFMVKGATLDEFVNQSETPSGFLEQIKLLTETSDIKKSENSWMIFLRIITSMVKHSDSEWRHLKGRIFSKFHIKKMAELSPTGIYNTSLLFMALANSADLNLCIKLCDLLCDSPVSAVKKLYTVCLGLATIAFFLISKSCRIDEVAEKIEKKVSSIHQECSSSIDTYERREVGHSVVVLCEGIQEVLQISTDLTLGQNKLFSAALSSFASQASLVEQGAIFSCIELGLQKICKATQNLHYLASGIGLDILESIWCNFQNLIKTQLRSLTPPSSLGSICSWLLISSSRFYSSNSCSNIQEATTLLTYIIDENLISNRMKMIFIKNLLLEKDSLEYISKICNNYDEKLINCLLLGLISDGASEEILAASEAIFSTQKLIKIVTCVPPCPYEAFKILIRNLAQQYKEAETFQMRIKVREKAFAYISSLDKSLTNLLKKVPLPSHIEEVFGLVGCIFSPTSSLYYIKGKINCPIPNLISAIVLPNSVYNMDKPLAPTISEALIPIFPQIINCLASLGPATDSYISRCLKDIFLNYMHRFPPATHPFMEVLSKDETPNTKDLRIVFIETININFISKRNCSLIHLQLVLSLLIELLRKFLDQWLDLMNALIFPSLLELLLYIEDLQTKRLASDLMRKLLQESEIGNLSSLVEEIRKFVSCHLAWHSSRVFRILDVIAVLNQNAIREALPGIEEAIKRTEEKRGSGEDQMLRKGYRALLNRLSIVNEENSFQEFLYKNEI